MTKRRSLTKSQRLDVLAAHGGRCYLCGETINLARARLGEADAFEVEHAHALGLGGADDPSNWRPAHSTCHKGKTARDVAAMAKVARVKAKHEGTYRPSRHPLNGGGLSRFKKKVGGTVVHRDTGEPVGKRS